MSVNPKRKKLESEINEAETLAHQNAERAEYREKRAEEIRAHAKAARANLNRLAAEEDKKATAYRAAERDARERVEELKVKLDKFDNSPEVLTIEQRLAALEARL